MSDTDLNRRPIATRDTGWARSAASRLSRSAITPNQISVASIVFAAIGTALLAWWPSVAGLLICALCIQLRLICNLLDGMVAIEGGRKSPTGALYNEFPDRSDRFLLSWRWAMPPVRPDRLVGALLAVATAYIRVLGGSLGTPRIFAVPWQIPPHGRAYRGLHRRRMPNYPARNARVAACCGLDPMGSLVTCFTRMHAIVAKCEDSTDYVVSHFWPWCAAGRRYAVWMGCQPVRSQRLYFANHSSHIDTLVLWSALPADCGAERAQSRRATTGARRNQVIYCQTRLQRAVHRPLTGQP